MQPLTAGARQLSYRWVALHGGKCHLRLEGRCVVPARSSAHGLSCSRRLSPLSGRNSTYRPVQISGAGSEAYDELIKAIQSLGTWWHHLETIWIVQCAHTPGEIRDRLKSRIGVEDQLLVVDISGDAAGWVGVNDIGSKWLAENI